MEFSKMHLNFCELSDAMLDELKKHIASNYKCNLLDSNYNKKTNYSDDEIKSKIDNIDIDIKNLFEINNAGIDIDIFSYLN